LPAAWETGLVNLHVPAEYGGAGLHALDGVVVGEELAYGCTGMMTAMEGNGLASAPVIIAGTDAQKVCVLAAARTLSAVHACPNTVMKARGGRLPCHRADAQCSQAVARGLEAGELDEAGAVAVVAGR
jgi:alkylation response protein AidB-like acyl-CoA dehydrogenase